MLSYTVLVGGTYHPAPPILHGGACGKVHTMTHTHGTHTAHGAYSVNATARRTAQRRGKEMTATAAAIFCAYCAARIAYQRTGHNDKRAAAIAAAIENGDGAAYRKLTARDTTAASAEKGLYGIRAAIGKAAADYNRLRGIMDGAARTAAVYDALATDTSGAALDMFGAAYVAIIERRGHARRARLDGDTFRAACNAANKVMYASKARTARTAGAVETVTTDADGAEHIGYIAVPKYWDVYDALTLADLQADIARIAAACKDRKAGRVLRYLLGGLSQAEIARRLGVSRAAITYTMRDIRRAYDAINGTTDGKRNAE